MQIVALTAPYIGGLVESDHLGIEIESHRIALYVIIVVMHLHAAHQHYVAARRVIVAALRLHQVVALRHGAAAVIATHACQGVEAEVMGI